MIMVPAASVLRFTSRRLVHMSTSVRSAVIAINMTADLRNHEEVPHAGKHQGQAQIQRGSAAIKEIPEMEDVPEDPILFQKSLGARAEQINLALLELKPKLTALKDPQARREVELHVRDLTRRGHLISEAKRKLDAILLERWQTW